MTLLSICVPTFPGQVKERMLFTPPYTLAELIANSTRGYAEVAKFWLRREDDTALLLSKVR